MTRRALTFAEENAIRRAGRVQITLREQDGGRVFTLDDAGVARWRATHAVRDDVSLVDLIRASVEEGAVEPGFVIPDGKFLTQIVMRAGRDIRRILARVTKDSHYD